jgi:hypothetical protein
MQQLVFNLYRYAEVLREGTIATAADGGVGGGGTLVFEKQTFRGDEDVLNTLVLNSRDTLLYDPARKAAVVRRLPNKRLFYDVTWVIFFVFCLNILSSLCFFAFFARALTRL